MKLRGQKKLKFIDRYLGIPLVFLFGFFRRNKNYPENIRKIGILLTPAIGDTILFSAPLKDLREKLKPDKVIIFVPEEGAGAAKFINIADEIVTINLADIINTILRIREYSLDLFIDSSQWARVNSLLAFFSKAKYRIGFDTKGEYRKYVYDSCAIHSDRIHEINNYRNLVSSARIHSESIPSFSSGISRDQKKIVIHINPGGYLSYLKEWPRENWIEVIEYLKSKDYIIFFTGSESDFNSVENILSKFPERKNLHNISGTMNLKQVSDLLESSRLVISVNTGIMHLASAVGANLIALHGPTNSLRWGPLNKNSVSVNSSYSSAPCLNLGFEYRCSDRTGECMKAIKVSEVLNAVDLFLCS